MTTELTQITNIVKSKNEKVENICYKEVHKIKISKENGDSPIVLNTKSILSKLIDYSNAYIQFQFDIKETKTFISHLHSTKNHYILKEETKVFT